MAQLVVRNIEPGIKVSLQRRAKRAPPEHGRRGAGYSAQCRKG